MIREELIDSLSAYYPEGMEDGTVIRVALPTTSGFVAVFELTGPNEIGRSYITSHDDL